MREGLKQERLNRFFSMLSKNFIEEFISILNLERRFKL